LKVSTEAEDMVPDAESSRTEEVASSDSAYSMLIKCWFCDRSDRCLALNLTREDRYEGMAKINNFEC
jgi:hypothetical protein